MRLKDNCTPQKLIKDLGYEKKEVEFVFVNGKVSPFETPLKNGNRVTIVPPGIPTFIGSKKYK